ncbi:hypothetical protein Taro_050069 [Colocasia esculenta]|uniref:Uncharacterized protein n=1 Tax=Colocasia esculenta TaxID=4460 RepID=A0A843XD11_COLES|nr:hypothetical protein [Colocasia esculenta]
MVFGPSVSRTPYPSVPRTPYSSIPRTPKFFFRIARTLFLSVRQAGTPHKYQKYKTLEINEYMHQIKRMNKTECERKRRTEISPSPPPCQQPCTSNPKTTRGGEHGE